MTSTEYVETTRRTMQARVARIEDGTDGADDYTTVSLTWERNGRLRLECDQHTMTITESRWIDGEPNDAIELAQAAFRQHVSEHIDAVAF